MRVLCNARNVICHITRTPSLDPGLNTTEDVKEREGGMFQRQNPPYPPVAVRLMNSVTIIGLQCTHNIIIILLLIRTAVAAADDDIIEFNNGVRSSRQSRSPPSIRRG